MVTTVRPRKRRPRPLLQPGEMYIEEAGLRTDLSEHTLYGYTSMKVPPERRVPHRKELGVLIFNDATLSAWDARRRSGWAEGERKQDG